MDDVERVDLEESFTQAIAKEVRHSNPPVNPEKSARALFDVPPRSGWYGYSQRQGVVSLDEQPSASSWAEVDVRVTREYLRFCEAIGKPGDCWKALMNNPVLTGDGRYALAMAFALEEVIPEMMEAFKDMADPEALRASILWTMTAYAAMWMAPEPVFSKGLATVVTASFICYIGVDTFWTLIQGWRRMVEVADLATSFSELREAGRNYGRVMGKNAARAFALLLSAAIGQTAASFSAKVPTLPGSAQASVVGAVQAGIRLTAVAPVQSVAVTANAVSIVLAPNAVAATAQSLRGAASSPVDAEGHEHHIATDKWLEATHSGGPWTPKFEQIFDKAGMSLNDPANKVRVKGHMGPHPREYHEHVFEVLRDATRTCRTIEQCRASLTKALNRLAQKIVAEDTYLNKLVTRTP
ncbi:AHH domain-containing protein [Cystobacter fuscus]|uniref:AHH domain-containing protein n=1 Tax=Cystobacter fuscus TaxID=43 RepID=UPI0037C0CF5C